MAATYTVSGPSVQPLVGMAGTYSKGQTSGTVKPARPPKPSHLSSVFTGTLNSEALRSYIKQHSQETVSKRQTMLQQQQQQQHRKEQSSYEADTFRTARQPYVRGQRRLRSSDDGENSSQCDTDDDEQQPWGTAKQSQGTPPVKSGLADLFAEPLFDQLPSQITIRGSTGILQERKMNSAQSAEMDSTDDSPYAREDHQHVPTIKVKGTPISFDLLSSESMQAHQLNGRAEDEERKRLPRTIEVDRRTASEASSSSNGTLRSRQPSILSRLSAFEDDEDEGFDLQMSNVTVQQEANNDSSLLKTSTDSIIITPRKKWMHARDGSAFERASPRPLNGSKLAIGGGSGNVGARPQQLAQSQQLQPQPQPQTLQPLNHFDRPVSKNGPGLPTLSDGMPLLLAGPPPLRPKSVIVEEAREPMPEQALSPEASTFPGQVEDRQVQQAKLQEPQQTSSSKSRQNTLKPGSGRRARALYAFEGERTFNELNLSPGQIFDILKEDVQDGWSLAAADQNGTWTKGLVPQGWYTYIQEFTASPLHKPTQDDRETGQAVSRITLNGTSGESKAVEIRSSENKVAESNLVESSSSSSLMIPMVRNHSAMSSGTSSSPQADDDHNRPASGVGQMSSSFIDHASGTSGAQQMLSQLSNSIAVQPFTKMNEASTPSQPDRDESVGTDPGQASSPTRSSSSAVLISADVSMVDDSIANTTMESMQSTSNTNASNSTPWRPPGLLGGRMLNRYAPFVVSGAEQFVLSARPRTDVGDDNAAGNTHRHNIIGGAYGGPAWQSPGVQMTVEVHSPEVHVDERNKEYTAYVVHTSYVQPASRDEGQGDDSHAAVGDLQRLLFDPYARPEQPTFTSSVYRRFNQFRWLSTHLHKLYPSIMLSLPPMPSASQGTGWNARFEAPFVERRRRHLQSWLTAIVRHPVLSADDGVRFFLENDAEEGEDWTHGARQAQKHSLHPLNSKSASQHVFAQTLHPMFNVDAAESSVEAKQLAKFNEVYERSMSETEGGVLSNVRNARLTTANNGESYRQMSLAILRMITGAHAKEEDVHAANAHLPRSPNRFVTHSPFAGGQRGFLPPMGNVGKRDQSGATNEDRAWCWREGCTECHRLTTALQVTAEAFQVVADDYRSHADGGMFELHDRLWNASKAQQQSVALLEVHKSALNMYNAAVLGDGDSFTNGTATTPEAERIAAACETVLNVTMSEMDRIHADRVQTWNAVSRQALDEMIDFHADALHNLRRAKARVDEALGVAPSSEYLPDDEARPLSASATGPILPSPYETQLSQPLVLPALDMPSMVLLEPSAAAKAIHPVALASEILSDWLGAGQGL